MVKEIEFAVMKEHTIETRNDVKSILKLLNGNGEEGLVTRVANNCRLTSHIPKILTNMNMVKGGIAMVTILVSIVTLTQFFGR